MSSPGSDIHGVTDIESLRAARAARHGGSLPLEARGAPDDLAELPTNTQDQGMNEPFARLEGSYDALKVVRPMTITVLGVLLAALIFVLSFMASELGDLNAKQEATNAKVDAIPSKLAEEFRAMRGEMAAQTSAIAASVTAARQMQPQVVVVPSLPPTPQPPNGGEKRP